MLYLFLYDKKILLFRKNVAKYKNIQQKSSISTTNNQYQHNKKTISDAYIKI
jgi:hypothetical protein